MMEIDSFADTGEAAVWAGFLEETPPKPSFLNICKRSGAADLKKGLICPFADFSNNDDVMRKEDHSHQKPESKPTLFQDTNSDLGKATELIYSNPCILKWDDCKEKWLPLIISRAEKTPFL